ncbi:alkaline phosphatase D family protein [Skeletonema marinoi]|uniref:Alkaline phosphatase D family protein n=1 Tax=Skeletonema marinoi TaxID=267567 RepID=A0AAD8YCY0_9STRA|nr:alkaline phosphatase D family protein [Skeletonema marinoi]
MQEEASADHELDASFPNINLTRIAFGSCHSRGAVNKRLSTDHNNNKTIWDTIAAVVQPQTFLWTGDAVYPPMEVKGDYPLEVLKYEFYQMKTNTTLGYASFIQNKMLEAGIYGTWDDHDYGGNDRGYELKGKDERRDAYLDFLGVKRKNNDRSGVYNSVEFGKQPNKVKVIFLDTRYARSKHCIPSVGSHPYVPHGAIFACLTRWLTAGFNLCSNGGEVLGEEQWEWFERQLAESKASMHIVVSSIQVLTTNPVVESWGHFPDERERLLKLINPVTGLVLLSGDVHHAEISSTKRINIKSKASSIIEVTSSGLTHSCLGGWYGGFCKPILDYFPKHRFKGGNVASTDDPSYFTKKNFGSISIDWKTRKFHVKVHNESGQVVLHTGPLEIDTAANLSESELAAVDKCIDGHFFITIHLYNMAALVGVVMMFGLVFWMKRRRQRTHTKRD